MPPALHQESHSIPQPPYDPGRVAGADRHVVCCFCLRCAVQMGKVHFGVLLGWSVVQSIVLWFMVNQIASNEAAEHRALDLYSCCCIVGYGMVPLLVLSVAVLFTPR